MEFECILKKKNKIEKWSGRLEKFQIYEDSHSEFIIVSKETIHCIIGNTFRGKFGCFPDFNVGCHLVNFNNRHWNAERLMKILGKINGITVEAALFSLYKSEFYRF